MLRDADMSFGMSRPSGDVEDGRGAGQGGGMVSEKFASLEVGEVRLRWLPGGDFWLDGGTLFATVPKSEWQCCRPSDADNRVRLCNDPLLIEVGGYRILVDTGLGNQLGAACVQEYRVSASWRLLEALEGLGIGREGIDHVVLTHGDFDHAGGMTMSDARGGEQVTFPGAVHHLQRAEWEDMRMPRRRSADAYNAAALAMLAPERLHLVDGDATILPGITLRHSGGHTRGHQVIEIRSGRHLALHLGDLLPTHCHTNPFWQLSYDNFPMDVIDQKIEYLERYHLEQPWFLLYHDLFVRACRLDRRGAMLETWPTPWAEVPKRIRAEASRDGSGHLCQ